MYLCFRNFPTIYLEKHHHFISFLYLLLPEEHTGEKLYIYK